VIDDVRLTLAALREAGPPPQDELVIRAMPSGPVGVYLGLDAKRRSHLLVETAQTASLPILPAAISIGMVRLEIGGRDHDLVDVVCEIDVLTEVFDHFVVAVVERLDGTASPVSVVLEIVERWRRFLVSPAGPPGRDLLSAVYGELVVVRDVVLVDPQRRVDIWAGPFGGRHDLRRGHLAIEVKTTRAHTGRVVTIHGEDQLEPPDGGSLHLHLVRLEEVPEGGGSVSSIVDELLAAGAPSGGLFDAITAAGVSPADLASAAEVRFDVRERLTFPVDDEMPRIVPDTFAAGRRPTGVVDLVYRLDLDHILDSALTPVAHGDLIARIAVAGAL
jgi:hypothetical protein